MRAVLVAVVASMFAGSAAQAANTPAVITNPDWLRRPTAAEVEGFWPADAGRNGGRAVISCVVTARGLLDKCQVASESPAGDGFGGAALLLAPLFQMRPKMVNGVAVGGGQVSVPVTFKTLGGSLAGLPTARVYNDLPWRQAPTAADLAAAFPTQAVGRVGSARVVLLCVVSSDGSLRDCETTSEAPAGLGFAKAARGLTKGFKVFSDWPAIKMSKDLSVSLPFDFRDPRLPVPPVEVVDPVWLQTPDPRMGGKLFPSDAAKAGLKTGVAVVDCKVAQSGKLTSCTVSSENPAGLGFGAAALAIADAMIMNPWTKQGDPVDGARVRMPIRVNLGSEASHLRR